MRTQLAAVRDRARPLTGLHPGADHYRRLVDGVTLCQHYLLGVSRSSRRATSGWLAVVESAARVVRADLDALRDSTVHSSESGNSGGPKSRSDRTDAAYVNDAFVVDVGTVESGAALSVELLARIHAVLIDITPTVDDRPTPRDPVIA